MSAQTVRAQYPYISMNKALKDLQNVSQYHDEQLLDYVKRFKQLRDVAVSYIGTDVLKEFIENSKDYSSVNGTRQKKMKEEAFDRWMAYLLIHGSDQDKYGSLINNFIAQFSLGHDQYPMTIQAATDALSNHKWDPKYYEKKNKRREKQREEREDTGDDDNVTSFAQKATFCYCCGADDHISTFCPKINSIAKKDWYVNKMHQHLQGQQDEETEYTADDDSHSTTSRNRRSGPGTETATTWNGFQRSGLFHFFQQKFQQFFDKQILTEKPEQVLKQRTKPEQPTNLRKVWLLDCGSTLKATICNPDFATNIRPSKNPIGMETNAGTTQLNMECDIPGRCTKPGEAWFDPQQLTNIFGFGSMADDYHVTYDNKKEDAFIIHSSDGRTIKFERTPEGLYAYTPSTDYLDDIAKLKKLTPPPTEMSHLVSTVKENRIGYTDRQFKDAKRARDLYHMVGCPTVENLKHILRQKIIKNCPVTIQDVNIAEKIFGPDVGTLKGKTTRRNINKVVKDDLVEIPPELLTQHDDLTLCFDIMYVNGIPIMTSIDKTVRYRSAVPLKGRKAPELYRGLDVIYRFYNKAGFFIPNSQCDREFKTLMDEVKDELNMTMNYTTTGEHESTAERNNRTIAERVRAAYHNLPYKAIPAVMMKYLVMVCTEQLNLFPAKGGISAYYSPHVLMSKKDWDYNKHCQAPFGAYVQAFHEEKPKNTNAPRTLDAIYLRPAKNKQGGHEVMDLTTFRPITRPRVWQVPVTDLVIRAVEQKAEDQGMKSLKFTNRRGQPLFPANWIAGVDYNNNENIEDDDEYIYI